MQHPGACPHALAGPPPWQRPGSHTACLPTHLVQQPRSHVRRPAGSLHAAACLTHTRLPRPTSCNSESLMAPREDHVEVDTAEEALRSCPAPRAQDVGFRAGPRLATPFGHCSRLGSRVGRAGHRSSRQGDRPAVPQSSRARAGSDLDGGAGPWLSRVCIWRGSTRAEAPALRASDGSLASGHSKTRTAPGAPAPCTPTQGAGAPDEEPCLVGR